MSLLLNWNDFKVVSDQLIKEKKRVKKIKTSVSKQWEQYKVDCIQKINQKNQEKLVLEEKVKKLELQNAAHRKKNRELEKKIKQGMLQHENKINELNALSNHLKNKNKQLQSIFESSKQADSLGKRLVESRSEEHRRVDRSEELAKQTIVLQQIIDKYVEEKKQMKQEIEKLQLEREEERVKEKVFLEQHLAQIQQLNYEYNQLKMVIEKQAMNADKVADKVVEQTEAEAIETLSTMSDNVDDNVDDNETIIESDDEFEPIKIPSPKSKKRKRSLDKQIQKVKDELKALEQEQTASTTRSGRSRKRTKLYCPRYEALKQTLNELELKIHY